jgi:hypothetical protein
MTSAAAESLSIGDRVNFSSPELLAIDPAGNYVVAAKESAYASDSGDMVGVTLVRARS